MSAWPSRSEDQQSQHSDLPAQYSNVPTSPSPLSPQVHQFPVIVTPAGSSPQTAIAPNSNNAHPRTSAYVSSPLNPNAAPSVGSRSRPVSWGGGAVIDKLTAEVRAEGSSGSGNSSLSSGEREKETIKGILSGSVGGAFGPYTPLRASFSMPASNHRFSTLSSVGSVISLTSDSKYPSIYSPGNTQSQFLPYSDNPHVDYASAPGDGTDEDDALHEPEYKDRRRGGPLNWRGFLNVLAVFFVIAALVTLFAGYPIISHFTSPLLIIGQGQGVNATGQAAELPNVPQLIDPETPDEVKSRTGMDGYDYELVFSDEFNTAGRTFYPGDDPFWEAVSLWYGATQDSEWYDPSQVTTADGALVITLLQEDAYGLPYRSGMLQSWNKFCFTNGYIEVAAVFPGGPEAMGYWPGAWLMGNLGRPGYGATTDGVWPYSYDTCDVGTYPNQTRADNTPDAAYSGGLNKNNNHLSMLSGQKLSSCTCSGEDHPGPANNVGRGAPEIDIFEAQKNKYGPGGSTSQSVQFAPFNADYQYDANYITVHNLAETNQSAFKGSGTQQSVSCLTFIGDSWFENNQPNGFTYTPYGLEWHTDSSDRTKSYVNYQVNNQPSWSMTGAAVGADPLTEISQRLIAEEPMSIIFNLAISSGYQTVDPTTLTFPAHLRIDYVRVYQRTDSINVGCNPDSHPTTQYIQDHIDAYTNVNLTTWGQAGYSWPKNTQLDNCT